jgi:hypothetical protein
MRSFYLSFVLLAASCAVDSEGRTLLVVGEHSEVDDEAALRGVSPFTTIQAAIDAASSGDTVSVAAGTYTEDLTMKDGVTVDGAGQGQSYVVGTVTFSGSGVSTLSGFSLMDPDYISTGARYGNDGVTISSGSAVIEDVGVHYYDVGVLAANATSVTLNDVLLSYNWYGAGSSDNTSFTLTNSLVGSNGAGGVYVQGGTATNISFNDFVANAFAGTSAYLVGAVAYASTSGSGHVLANNIVVSNYYGLDCYSCSLDQRNNLVWGNTTDYINDAAADSSELSIDPLFEDSAEGNFKITAGSPCVDAGTSTVGHASDHDGDSRPQGSGYDIGMDEYASSTYDLLVTEVMANPLTESTQEFVEIYNAGSSTVDLAGFMLTDGDEVDTLQAFGSSATTLAPGEYAVVLDPEYASGYTIAAGVTLLTTGDTEVGNGLTTGDPVKLLQDDGSTVAASFSYPRDPGNGVSLEMIDLENGDTSGNWRASDCTDNSSPGAANCFAPSGDPQDLIITEVMANATSETSGEYIEIYNAGTLEIDGAGLMIRDSSASDKLRGFQGGSTLIGPGEHAVILDAGYLYEYHLPSDVVLLTTFDNTLGNGLSVRDSVTLQESDGATTIDSYTAIRDPGDGVSVEKIDYALGNVVGNWQSAATSSARGRSPGLLNGAAGGVCDVLRIAEVMSNPLDEDTGEFIEIYNTGTSDIDLAGLVLSDGTEDDVISAYSGGSTVVPAGGYAVIVDSEYAGEYSIPAGATIVTLSNSTLGNGLSVKDEVTLYEADGEHVIDSHVYPINAGNGTSTERITLSGALDSASNWAASTCGSGSSPGEENCVSTGSSGSAESSWDILITEVMANPLDESTGEFIELYNNGSTSVDLLYAVIWDGDALDTIFGFTDIYDAVLAPGEYAVILDADYAGQYTIPAGALILTADDSTLGSGLATNDPVSLYEGDGVAIVDSFSFPTDPGNGKAIERVSLSAGDVSTNWTTSTCSAGSSPGGATCP